MLGRVDILSLGMGISFRKESAKADGLDGKPESPLALPAPLTAAPLMKPVLALSEAIPPPRFEPLGPQLPPLVLTSEMRRLTLSRCLLRRLLADSTQGCWQEEMLPAQVCSSR